MQDADATIVVPVCFPGDEGNFSRIIVYDRASRRLVEEQISPTLVLAMRNMYQSRVRCDKGFYDSRFSLWLNMECDDGHVAWWRSGSVPPEPGEQTQLNLCGRCRRKVR